LLTVALFFGARPGAPEGRTSGLDGPNNDVLKDATKLAVVLDGELVLKCGEGGLFDSLPVSVNKSFQEEE
jgi:hypothetical protein